MFEFKVKVGDFVAFNENRGAQQEFSALMKVSKEIVLFLQARVRSPNPGVRWKK